jgi:hypothetical protein
MSRLELSKIRFARDLKNALVFPGWILYIEGIRKELDNFMGRDGFEKQMSFFFLFPSVLKPQRH